MKTLLLQDGDLVFAGGEFRMVEGPEEVAQSCRVILGTRRGEWFLNPDMGIDFDLFNGKAPNPEEMQDELRAGLAQEPRIQTVEDITITANKTDRTQLVSFTATAVDGQVISEEVDIGA